MDNDQNNGLLRLTGLAGILCGLFIPGVIIQIPVTGWFPAEALNNSTIIEWLKMISLQKGLVLTGIGFSILAIISFFVFGISLSQVLPKNNWSKNLASSLNIAGASLALAAFVLAYGFTWALIDLQNASALSNSIELSTIASVSLRGFLWGDDIGTTLIAISNLFFAVSAYKAELIPKWLYGWAIIAAILVCAALLRYFAPILEIGSIGYPMVILWFVLCGVILLKKSKR